MEHAAIADWGKSTRLEGVIAVVADDAKSDPKSGSGDSGSKDPILLGEEIIEKAKTVSQRIRERVRKICPDDTTPDLPALPTE